jgi:Uma2 family endonuclease
MAIPLRKDAPFNPPADLGPYRRKDYEALPDEPRYELIYGRFCLSPSPSVLHQLTVGLLYEILTPMARSARGLAFMAPTDAELAIHSVVQPDLFYVSSARRRIIRKRVAGAPDLVVEVVSPGTADRDRNEKPQLYLDAGVREYWIVDPLERRIDFLRNESGQFVAALMEGLYRSQEMPELSLDIAGLWQELDVRLAELDEDEDD